MLAADALGSNDWWSTRDSKRFLWHVLGLVGLYFLALSLGRRFFRTINNNTKATHTKLVAESGDSSSHNKQTTPGTPESDSSDVDAERNSTSPLYAPDESARISSTQVGNLVVAREEEVSRPFSEKTRVPTRVLAEERRRKAEHATPWNAAVEQVIMQDERLMEKDELLEHGPPSCEIGTDWANHMGGGSWKCEVRFPGKHQRGSKSKICIRLVGL